MTKWINQEVKGLTPEVMTNFILTQEVKSLRQQLADATLFRDEWHMIADRWRKIAHDLWANDQRESVQSEAYEDYAQACDGQDV